MTTNTHCLPTGVLGTGQLPVPGVPGLGTVQDPGPPRRGVVVLCHGLIEGINTGQFSDPVNNPFGFIPVYFGDLANGLQADGWVVLQISYPEDAYSAGPPSFGLANDIANDTGDGARYLTSSDFLFDHVVDWVRLNYPGAPIYPVGFSEGAYHALSWAANRSSEIVGALGHCPPTIWSNVSPIFVGDIYAVLNTSGMDLGAHALDATRCPVMVSYGTNDQAVAWSGHTILTSASNGVDVASFTGSGVLHVVSSANFVNFVSVQVPTTNGYATISMTGTGTGTITGCNTLNGSGLLTTGNTVVQSLTDQMITNAGIAGADVYRNASVGENHQLSPTDVTTFLNWTSAVIDQLAPAVH